MVWDDGSGHIFKIIAQVKEQLVLGLVEEKDYNLPEIAVNTASCSCSMLTWNCDLTLSVCQLDPWITWIYRQLWLTDYVEAYSSFDL